MHINTQKFTLSPFLWDRLWITLVIIILVIFVVVAAVPLDFIIIIPFRFSLVYYSTPFHTDFHISITLSLSPSPPHIPFCLWLEVIQLLCHFVIRRIKYKQPVCTIHAVHYFNHIEMLCETRYYCLTIKLDLKFIVDLAVIISVLLLVSIFDEHIHHCDHCSTTNTLTEIFIIYCHRNKIVLILYRDYKHLLIVLNFMAVCKQQIHEMMKHSCSHRIAVWKPILLPFFREGAEHDWKKESNEL